MMEVNEHLMMMEGIMHLCDNGGDTDDDDGGDVAPDDDD